MFKMSLQKLAEIKQANDTTLSVQQLREAKENLILAEKQLANATDRWEFESIEGNVKDLKWTIQQLKNKVTDTQEMSHLKMFSAEDVSDVVETFNADVNNAEKAYKQNVSKIIGQIEKMNNEIAMNVALLNKFENTAINVQEISNYIPVENRKELKSIELHRVKKTNLQVVTLSEQLVAIQKLLSEVGGAK